MNGLRHQRISERQNEPDLISLLAASTVAHRRAQLVENGRWFTAFALSSGALLASLDPAFRPWASIGAVAGTLLVQFVWAPASKRLHRRAILFQEAFDSTLFGLPWNRELGEKPVAAHVAELAGQFKGSFASLRDWYVDLSGIPSPVAETLCQRQNVLWDSDERSAWARNLTILLVCIFAFGFLVALVADWTVRSFLLLYVVPSLPLGMAIVGSVSQNRSAAESKHAIRAEIDALLEGLGPETVSPDRVEVIGSLLRARQNGIFAARVQAVRVPRWFYLRLRERYERSHRVESQVFRRAWVVT